MPIYEYQCAQCGHQVEVLQKFSDEPLRICPKCSAPALNKLISATSFQLKGTGWYATDTRDKGKPPAAPEASEAKPDAKTTSSETTVSDASSSTDSTKTAGSS